MTAYCVSPGDQPPLLSLSRSLQVFALFDHDGSGRIGFRELKRVVTELGENIGDDEMREMIEEADRDGDGEAGCHRRALVRRRQLPPLQGMSRLRTFIGS